MPEWTPDYSSPAATVASYRALGAQRRQEAEADPDQAQNLIADAEAAELTADQLAADLGLS